MCNPFKGSLTQCLIGGGGGRSREEGGREGGREDLLKIILFNAYAAAQGLEHPAEAAHAFCQS
jgi:hypothetical protein